MGERSFALIAAFAACLASGSPARANVGETYGFGSRTAALGGAGAAWGSDAFAAYDNPAALALPGNKRLSIGYGFLWMTPNFIPINNVVVENTFTSDKSRADTVDTSYRDTFGQVLGLSYELFPDFHNLSLGVTTFFPLSQIAYLDTGETFEPEYVLYRARTQRPQIDFALGAELSRSVRIGLGALIAYSMTGNADLFLNSTNSSSMRFSASLKPKLAPYASLLISPSDRSPEEKGHYSFGVVARAPVSSDDIIYMKAGASFISGFAALDFVFTASSAMYYDPGALEIGGSWKHSKWGRLYAQVDWQLWGLFEPPALVVQQPTIANCAGTSSCGMTIAPSINPAFDFQNILVPRVGEEIELSAKTILRVGYSYHPSILNGVPDGPGNYLDPPKHSVDAGVGFLFRHFLSFEAPWELDLHFSYQQLIDQTIVKTPGDESGAAGAKIGAPGYTAGGNILGGGVSLSLAF